MIWRVVRLNQNRYCGIKMIQNSAYRRHPWNVEPIRVWPRLGCSLVADDPFGLYAFYEARSIRDATPSGFSLQREQAPVAESLTSLCVLYRSSLPSLRLHHRG